MPNSSSKCREYVKINHFIAIEFLPCSTTDVCLPHSAACQSTHSRREGVRNVAIYVTMGSTSERQFRIALILIRVRLVNMRRRRRTGSAGTMAAKTSLTCHCFYYRSIQSRPEIEHSNLPPLLLPLPLCLPAGNNEQHFTLRTNGCVALMHVVGLSGL